MKAALSAKIVGRERKIKNAMEGEKIVSETAFR
jgi:hypothetical protein